MRTHLTGLLLLLIGSARAIALEGEYRIHDPSTLAQSEGKYYTYGTGGTCLISEDGWSWHRGVVPARRGMAPDLIHVGDRYLMYVARNVGAQPRADINLIWAKSLDTNSPLFKWEEEGVVAGSDGVEDCNAIDPGLLLDPNDGRLWMVYGSYFGFIRLVELDPRTGLRREPQTAPVNLAVNCEAAILIHEAGWYYLLATHGSCCRGADSGYNIRMGRSRQVTGPYLDHEGVDMIRGGGKLFAGSSGRVIGPGHFGRIRVAAGLEKFSCHYEADLDLGGASVLDIRPLLWKDGWPVAGENLKDGTYQIESLRTGTALELAVEGMPVGGRRERRGGPGGGGGIFGGSGRPIPDQDVAELTNRWPAGEISLRIANYLCQAQQKWRITGLTNMGGFLGAPFYKICLANTDRALAATAEGELVLVPTFTGAPEQLWQIDQLSDGTWRLQPKAIPGRTDSFALSAVGASFATLSRFDPTSNKHRWILKAP